jgi:hypothetical protein
MAPCGNGPQPVPEDYQPKIASTGAALITVKHQLSRQQLEEQLQWQFCT